MRISLTILGLSALTTVSQAWMPASTRTSATRESKTTLWAAFDRRDFGRAVWGAAAAAAAGMTIPPVANAQVFMDPAQYGDQELRVGAVDSLRESVRRAILKNPQLAPSFYQLALLDGLSYNAKTTQYGPDSSIVKIILSSKETDSYTKNLKEASLALIDAERALRKKTAITLADAVAIGGAEAIESIGGPILPVQLGRADAPLEAKVNTDLPIDLFNGKYSPKEVTNAFARAGVTEREMTSLLLGLLTLEQVEKSRTTEDWKRSSKPKFREPGKIGRMSEFRKITEEDIAEAEAQAALEADPDYEDPDDGWYIADSFGTRESRFGERLAAEDINEKTFNKYVKVVLDAQKDGEASSLGWIAVTLLDPSLPGTVSLMQKYATSNINFVKDLAGAFNAITQLGAVFTGGKYENLLKSKPRKSLNDDDLNLF